MKLEKNSTNRFSELSISRHPSIEDTKERLRLFGQEDHVRKYGPDFEDGLKEAGFKTQVIGKSDILNPEQIKTMGLTYWDGRIYICKKQNRV